MVEYKCEICDKTFGKKSHYMTHLNKKIKCVKSHDKPINTKTYGELIEIVNELTNEIKELTNKDNGSVNKLKKTNIKLTDTNKKLATKNKDMAKKLKEYMKNIKNLTKINKKNEKQAKISNCKIVDNTHNDSCIIKLNAFGKETINMNDKKMARQIIDRGYYAPDEYILRIHFNKQNPQNHNAYISNLKTDIAYVFNGEAWEVRDRDEVIDELKAASMEYIKTQYDKIEFDPSNRKDNATVAKNDRLMESYEDEDEKYFSIDKRIELIMYNNREIVEHTRNEIKKAMKNAN